MVGGALYIATFVMVTYEPFAELIWSTLLGNYAYVYALYAPMYLLLMMGALGVYARQRGDFGFAGKSGFYLTALGFDLGAVGSVAVLAMVVTGGDGAALWLSQFVAHAVSHVLYAVGSLLLGLATFRTGLLPRAAAVMIGLGPAWQAVLFVVDSSQSSLLLLPPFAITALGWAWLGYALMRRAGVPVRPEPLLPAAPGNPPDVPQTGRAVE
jgi:hypothetical protein